MCHPQRCGLVARQEGRRPVRARASGVDRFLLLDSTIMEPAMFDLSDAVVFTGAFSFAAVQIAIWWMPVLG